jgi:hypothetical protein
MLAGSYSFDNTTVTTPADYNLKLGEYPTRRQNGVLSLRHVLSLSLINVSRAGVSRTYAGGGVDGQSNALVGGWPVGGIHTIQSGFPFSLRLGSDRAGTGSSQEGGRNGGQRPMYVNAAGCSPDVVTGNSSHYFLKRQASESGRKPPARPRLRQPAKWYCSD